MTQDELFEAHQLVGARDSLRWNIARNNEKSLHLYAEDDDNQTTQPRLPASIGRHVWQHALELVETRLQELGIDPAPEKLERDCYDCGGSGKRPMS